MVLRDTLFMKPGSGGAKPMSIATTLRQLVAYLAEYRYMPWKLYMSGTETLPRRVI